jgi:integrase
MPRRRERRGIYISITGATGRAVAVQERPDAPGRARVRWIDDDGCYQYVPLRSLVLRDDHGREIPAAVEQAHVICAAASRARAAGEDIADAVRVKLGELGLLGCDGPPPLPIATAAAAAPATSGRHTLAEVFDLYFAIGTGKYVTDSRQRRDEMGMRNDIFLVIPASTRVSDLRTAHYGMLWRGFAEFHYSGKLRRVRVGRPPSAKNDTSGTPSAEAERNHAAYRWIPWGGLRHAERAVNTLRKLLMFAVNEGHLQKERPPAMPEQWQSTLKSEWAKIAEKHKVRPVSVRPVDRRYDEHEGVSFFRALCNADPRLRLLLELFVLWRLGQALRVRRSDIDFAAGDFGAIRCEGRGQKWGIYVWLTQWQRQVLDDALGGYLARYEALYQADPLNDYPLIPGDRINSRKDVPGDEPLTESGLANMFLETEDAAGITHMDGRRWYGLRRLAMTLVDDLCYSDDRLYGLLTGTTRGKEESEADRTANAMSGHAATATRGIYVNGARPAVWRRAIAVMEAVRRALEEPNPPMEDTRQVQESH